MDRVIRVKDGVEFTVIAPSGFRILEAINSTARHLGYDLWITSACDGEHSGPNDPHHRGEAYDVRIHEFNARERAALLGSFKSQLPEDQFFCFIESEGTPNEHFHLQAKKGTTYP